MKTVKYFVKNMSIVVGLVLIWRGIWYILDDIDQSFFSGDHTLTAIGGVVIGLLILYLPDHDLKELQKL